MRPAHFFNVSGPEDNKVDERHRGAASLEVATAALGARRPKIFPVGYAPKE